MYGFAVNQPLQYSVICPTPRAQRECKIYRLVIEAVNVECSCRGYFLTTGGENFSSTAIVNTS
jgi:hypothetical protein